MEKAIDLKNKNNYDRVWAVFDRDEFPAKDFNEAIAMGQKNSIEVAWVMKHSNCGIYIISECNNRSVSERIMKRRFQQL